MESSLVLLSRHYTVRASAAPDIQHNLVTAIPKKILASTSTNIASMHLRPFIGCLLLISALRLPPLHAQTDHPSSTTQVTRAIAVYEWTGDLAHPTAARLVPVSLFIHGQLQDAGVYLAQPIPFALQPGTLYLLQHAGQTGIPDGRSLPAGVETIGALDIQSAHTNPTPSAPSWAAYGRFLTPAEATADTTPKPSLAPLAADTDTTPPAPPNPKKKNKQQAYVTPPTTPILDDPDRPILEAGQPAAPATVPELTTSPPDLHQAAAVSDAANRPPETFAYPWPSPSIRDQTLHTLEALALPHLTHYIAFNHLTPAPTDPSSRPEAAGRSGETPVFAATTANPTTELSSVANAAPTLIHPQLLAYTLADTTTPTYILTAESPLTTNGPIYLTLIAQPGAAGQLHLALLSITDAAHLDRTPWLRPIDAVDPDATGRANLLFELRSQTTRQFALYTLTTAQPQQTLLTTPME
jgi:hypothetical protein